MANDCLYRKYIGSVDNNTIPKKDCLLFPIVPTSDTFNDRHSSFKMTFTGEFTINALGGAYFVTTQFSDLSDESKRKTTETFQGGDTITIWLGNSAGYLEITNKYGCTYLDADRSNYQNYSILHIELSQLIYLDNFINNNLRGNLSGNINNFNVIHGRILTCNGGELFGNIDELADKNNLRDINIYTDGYVYGDIKSFGKNTSLIRVRIPNTGITGTIEEFVKELIAAGKTSTTDALTLNITNTDVTFKGEKVNGGDTTLAWTSDGSTATITVGSDSETIDL